MEVELHPANTERGIAIVVPEGEIALADEFDNDTAIEPLPRPDDDQVRASERPWIENTHWTLDT